MRITVFTSNQPRHISIIKGLASIANEVFAVQECNTVFPGQVEDFFKHSAVMQAYFKNVMEAERSVFGFPEFLPSRMIFLFRQVLGLLALHYFLLILMLLLLLKLMADSNYFYL